MSTLMTEANYLRGMLGTDRGILVSCDYDQVEARVAAGFSQDGNMLQAVATGNVHAVTAELMYGPGYSKDHYKYAKIANFTCLFGGGPKAIALQCRVPAAAGREIWTRWTGSFSRYFEWANEQSELSEVTLVSGRVIPCDPQRPWANSNYVIQGSAREMLSHAILTQEKDPLLKESRLWLAVHDEVIRVAYSDPETVAARMEASMTFDLMGVHFSAGAEILTNRWGK
jgi:DNA polymerase-1